MMNRKTFLKATAATVAAASLAPIVTLLEGCSSSAPVLQAKVSDNKAIVPLDHLAMLASPNSHAKIYVNQNANPIILFAGENGEMRAVLSTCSHSGCEVTKLRTTFECPCHGSEYDLQGNVLRGPAPEPLEVFQVEKVAGRLEISLKGRL